MYLSVSRYRAAGFGITPPEDDAELRAVLARASSLVDVYCGIPMQPSRHDFRGGTITGEQHAWNLATWTSMGSRRVYPIHRPIRAVTGFRVKFTNDYQVAIAPSNLYIQKIEGWVEVVSLAAVVTGIYPVGVNFGLYTPVAEIDYTYGYSFSIADELLYVTDGNTFQGSRGYWEADPEIKVDGVVVNSGFTVDLDEGEVTFDVAQSATARVTASYSYTLPDAFPEATGIVATQLLGEGSLAAKGMSGLSSLKVAEVALARTNRGALSLAAEDLIPVAASGLLAPFVFRSVA